MPTRYSHPAEDGQPAVHLRDHLDDVVARVRIVVPAEKTTPFGSSSREFVSKLAQVHDFGKLTTWFQTHISGERPSGPSHHSPIGALLAYHVLDSTGHESEECLAGYVAVATHHGTLPNVAEYVFDRTVWNKRHPDANRRKQEVLEQIKDIDEGAPELAGDIIRDASNGETTWDEFADGLRSKQLYERVKSRVSRYGTSHDTHGISPEFYPCLLQGWSALVLADKTSAAHAPVTGFDHALPPRETLTAFIEGLSDGSEDLPPKQIELNGYRRMAREEVLGNARELIVNGERLATITLPTGMGKTLTGLDAALKIRDETDRRRVVYALPFTSIIDQVVGEVSEIYGTDGTDDLLTVHHHLAETTVEFDADGAGDESDEYDRIAGMLGESWRAGLVVTTFVQLFESLTGPANTQSMKLPALYDSVVVLDEPQSLPHDWWPLIDRLVEILTTKYDATVLAMTATQPRLFDRNVPELVDDPRTYFDAAVRTEYVLDDSINAFPNVDGALGYDDAATELIEAVDLTDDVLAVCNTIDSAIALTDSVEKRIESIDVGRVLESLLREERETVTGAILADRVEARPGDIALVHLSTRIRPRDRLLLINAMKELTARALPVYAVSTQLIEAGVDISFNHVFRDFAPIDNLVQAAGRCNRSFERDRGTVTLWWLREPGDQESTPGQAVYDEWGESLLRVTSGVLDALRPDESVREDEHTWLDEPAVAWGGVRDYYRRLTEERRVGRRSYVEYLELGEIDSLGELSLIDQRLAIEVIVCRTDADRSKIEAIFDAWTRFEFSTVDTLMRELRPNQISVPIYRSDSREARELADLPRVHAETDIRWIDPSLPEFADFFDPATGFVVPDNTVERRFL